MNINTMLMISGLIIFLIILLLYAIFDKVSNVQDKLQWLKDNYDNLFETQNDIQSDITEIKKLLEKENLQEVYRLLSQYEYKKDIRSVTEKYPDGQICMWCQTLNVRKEELEKCSECNALL